jgi:hypothetical protein
VCETVTKLFDLFCIQNVRFFGIGAARHGGDDTTIFALYSLFHIQIQRYSPVVIEQDFATLA